MKKHVCSFINDNGIFIPWEINFAVGNSVLQFKASK